MKSHILGADLQDLSPSLRSRQLISNFLFEPAVSSHMRINGFHIASDSNHNTFTPTVEIQLFVECMPALIVSFKKGINVVNNNHCREIDVCLLEYLAHC